MIGDFSELPEEAPEVCSSCGHWRKLIRIEGGTSTPVCGSCGAAWNARATMNGGGDGLANDPRTTGDRQLHRDCGGPRHHPQPGTPPMTDDLKKLSEEATAGTWSSHVEALTYPECDDNDYPAVIRDAAGNELAWLNERHHGGQDQHAKDAAFIVAAVNHVRAALAAPEADRGVQGFLNAIMDASPNGEWIAVQYHPNGDWSVAETPVVPEAEAVKAWLDGDLGTAAEAVQRAIAGRAALEAENKRLADELDLTHRRYQYLANATLACDYGDNPTKLVGWCLRFTHCEPILFGDSIDAAIDAAIAERDRARAALTERTADDR